MSNTQRNIETIGLLGGSLSADGSSFNINTLIIPKQKGETDRVEMLKEEEIWDIFFQVAAMLASWTLRQCDDVCHHYMSSFLLTCMYAFLLPGWRRGAAVAIPSGLDPHAPGLRLLPVVCRHPQPVWLPGAHAAAALMRDMASPL